MAKFTLLEIEDISVFRSGSFLLTQSEMHLFMTLHILPQANPSLWFMSTLRIHTLEQSLSLGDSHQ